MAGYKQLKSIKRRDALALWPDLVVCDDYRNCRKKYPPKPGWRKHKYGFVDNWNVIHLSDLDKRVRVQGMYQLCVLVGRAQPEIKRLPEHYKIWRSHVWANAELRAKFHRASSIEWSVTERIQAWRLAERAGMFMNDDLQFYTWCYMGRRLALQAGDRAARSQHRNYISDGLIDAWVADRAAGMSFGQIGKKYNRDFRIVWKALVRRGLHQPDAA